MGFFRSENQSKKILRINKSETEIHSPPGHFLTKRKSDVKSHHQYINQEKNETKTRIIKKKQGSNWSFHLELSQKTEKTMRQKRKKLRGCPLVRAV